MLGVDSCAVSCLPLHPQQRVCTLHGGHLAILRSADELTELAARLAASLPAAATAMAGPFYWVGLLGTQRPAYRWELRRRNRGLFGWMGRGSMGRGRNQRGSGWSK